LRFLNDALEQLIEFLTNFQADPNWDTVGEQLNKPAQDCQSWYTFIVALSTNIPARERSRASFRKRKRRKASQINRAFPCQVPGCKKSYGTEGALKFHIQNKHKDFKYIPSYLHPYNASGKPMGSGGNWNNDPNAKPDTPVLVPQIMLTQQSSDVSQLPQFAPYQIMRNHPSLVPMGNPVISPESFNGVLPTTATIVDGQPYSQ